MSVWTAMGPRFDLDARARDAAIALRSGLSSWGVERILDAVCWQWSGSIGKHIGCPFWSADALSEFGRRGRTRYGDWCVHEHVVPRTVLFRLLREIENPDEASVRRALDVFAIGCVVTPEEDGRLRRNFRSVMPPSFRDRQSPGYGDPWLRYKELAIEVVGPLRWSRAGEYERPLASSRPAHRPEC
ncbi:MAG: hypothetical protein HRU70_04810 [Phycisphaeraceae bacterium]|nr:MAG: hypothetical protein HRU70_04810 [Phycisphaeraceae bacterium]